MGSELVESSSEDREIAQGTNEHIVSCAADEIPTRRDRVGQHARTVRNIENGMSGERERQHRQCVTGIAHERRCRDDQKAYGEGNVEANTLLAFLGDGKSDVRAGRQRQE